MSNYSLTNSLEWLNGNMHRNYPIVDSVVVKTTEDDPRQVKYLPPSFLTDMQLIVPYTPGIDASKFFLSSVTRIGDSIQLTIGYMISNPGEVLQGFDCAVSSAIPLDLVYEGMDQEFDNHVIKLSAIAAQPTAMYTNTYYYGIPDTYAAMRGMRGTVYIGTCSDMVNAGPMRFLYENAAIMPPCVYIEDAQYEVQSIKLVDSYGTNATLTDDIKITLAEGIKANVSDDQQTVTFELDQDAIDDRLRQILSDAVGTAIHTINGVGPDDKGEFWITGLDCTQIDTNQYGISINNPCSKPCCDQNGTDSSEILKALTELSTAKDVLNNYYTDLATKVNLMQARLSSLIASRR